MINGIKIGVVILAAGSSSRLGHAKQLVEFKGSTLLQRVIDLTSAIDFDVNILVLGANYEKIKTSIKASAFEIIENKEWSNGMASSLKLGLEQALDLDQSLSQIVVLLSDQPFVGKTEINRLIEVQLDKQSPATFSEYDGIIGVPAIFSVSLVPELMKLEGDQGAKKLLSDKAFDYQTIPFEKGIFDVDTPEDVERLHKMEQE
ncbi:molybdenum cofactor cytidylyltransferase [Nonlabens sp. Hel1_33_55]|uniref:nucleotidyltransferase family protein n=1 Tax=Nonlabens sp. Hel1_33_55 TaxID=1336802 RepID=UPI000875EC98|nr:nucleotidyltransferase family protein [Nonlabens sp. Hel1_33_55]SCX98916.1 molybdenum cofactor cytidylyltransferase [Nonlabens sp. Hel1_33_55]